LKEIHIKIAKSSKELTDIKEIRRQVFQKEQGISTNLDFDGKDDESDQIIAYINNHPVGTARIRYIDNVTDKIERMAVLKEFRKRDIGKQIVKYISNYIKRKGLKKIILNAQESARGFYEKLGFNQEGDVFEEANIPHVKMYKNLEKWLL